MFNLNDPRWGRGGDDNNKPESKPENNNGNRPEGGPPKGPNQGPPDLDELWRDFNR
ncbi:MAG: protease modulator HflK, partial [Haliea sp.]